MVTQSSKLKTQSSKLVSPGAALFLLLFGWYALTGSGHTYTSDEETMIAVGERLLDTGSFVLPKSELLNRAPGIGGDYSRYGPAQSLAAIPFILAGRAAALAAPPKPNGPPIFAVRLLVALLPALVTAATALIVYAWVRAVGYSTRISLLVGLLFGLTSLAWPYSRTFFAEPMATLWLALCGYGLRRAERRWWALAGAAGALALASKFQVLLALPLLAIYAVLAALPDRSRGQGTGDRGQGSGVRGQGTGTGNSKLKTQNSKLFLTRSFLRGLLGRIGWGTAGLALPLGLLLLYNTLLFGAPLNSGYGGANAAQWLSKSDEDGLYGLTISSGKGILFFAPTILLVIAGLFARVRQQWREALLGAGMLVLHVWFYQRLGYWHGDGSWGPRYLVFVMPFIYLPVAGLLAELEPRTKNQEPVQRGLSSRSVRGLRFARWAVLALATASFVVQLMPVLFNFNTYIQLSDGHARFFEPASSPIVMHARLWWERAGEWVSRAGPPPAGEAVLRRGFSYSEGDRGAGELFPRWTNADALVELSPRSSAPLEGRLLVGDHRPPPLPRAAFALLLDGAPLANVQRRDRDGKGIDWELRFTLSPAQVRPGTVLTLHSSTWNPTTDTKTNPRNENLGVLLQALELTQDGQPLALRESLPLPPLGNTRRTAWLWFFDPPNHHLFDAWLWYVFVAGLPPRLVALLLGLVGLPALLALGVGLRGVAAGVREPGIRNSFSTNDERPTTK